MFQTTVINHILSKTDKIRSIQLSGSATMDFLEPNDYDVFVIVDPSTSEDELLRLNSDMEELEEEGKPIICHFFTELPIHRHMTFYAYLDRFRKTLYGENLPVVSDIFERKDEYLGALKKAVAHLKKFPKAHKILYHVLIGAFMLKNGSYDLTADQIEIVKEAHSKDDGSYERNLELAESLIKELGSATEE